MSKRLIVSMTSYPKRIAMAFDMIKKLENQTKKPDKVVLYLSKDEFPGCAFAEDVKPYAGELDFEIHWVEGNMKPHKKYYYAFQEYRDDYIITMDDDIIYAEDTIECFMRAAKKFPHTVLSMRTHLITRDVDGNIEAYDHWAQKCYEYVNEPRMDLIAVGAGGCLYEPSLFDDEIFHIENIISCCLCTDDLWLKMMQLISGIPVVLIADRPKYRDLGEDGLYTTVNKYGGNDRSWKKLWEIYKDYNGKKGFLNERIMIHKLLTARQANNISLYKAQKLLQSFWEETIGEKNICLYGAGMWAQRIIRVLDDMGRSSSIQTLFVKETDSNFHEIYGKKVKSVNHYLREDFIVVALADRSKLEVFLQLTKINGVDPSKIILLRPDIYHALQIVDQAIEKEKYKVSVIIPVYNVAPYLEECMNSVRRQTLKDIEIICINDCSEDCSMDVLKKYEALDSRIKLFENPQNKGLSASRNVGMEFARGKYICFVDSDDFIAENAIEVLYEMAEDKNTDVIISGAVSFIDGVPDKKEEYFTNRLPVCKLMAGKDIFNEMMRIGDMRIIVPAQFWNRQSLETLKLRFYEGILHEDTLFSYYGYIQAKRAMCVPYSFYYYRQRKHSITDHRPGARDILSMLLVCQEVLNYWLRHRNDHIDEVTTRFLRGRRNIINEKVLNMDGSLDQIFEKAGAFSLQSLLLDFMLDGENKRMNYFGKENYGILKNSRNNFIYGAGQIAKEVIQNMKEGDIHIDGILVSGLAGNPENVQGIPVTCITQADMERIKAGYIVLGVGKRNMESVIDLLEKYQISNYMILTKYRKQ